MIRFSVITPAVAEPLTLTEAKGWLQLDEIGEDDALVYGLMATARETCEAETGKILMTTTLDQYFDCFPGRCIELAFGPVQSVTSVKYLDSAAAEQTYSATNYTVDTSGPRARIVLKDSAAWPSHGSFPNAVIVRYIAGYTSAAAVPKSLKTAMLLEMRLLYDNREDTELKGGPAARSAGWLKMQHRNISV